ncbi:hypothetical protein EES41_39560 (plasmid) [Streptomyces sp. ADI95-16]|nr:hypothetical protein EES41_39560 [Streptomyces sp. ADI95-16]
MPVQQISRDDSGGSADTGDQSDNGSDTGNQPSDDGDHPNTPSDNGGGTDTHNSGGTTGNGWNSGNQSRPDFTPSTTKNPSAKLKVSPNTGNHEKNNVRADTDRLWTAFKDFVNLVNAKRILKGLPPLKGLPGVSLAVWSTEFNLCLQDYSCVMNHFPQLLAPSQSN